jgi:hypothetical protein
MKTARRRMRLLRGKIDAQQQARERTALKLSRRTPLDDLALRLTACTLMTNVLRPANVSVFDRQLGVADDFCHRSASH